MDQYLPIKIVSADVHCRKPTRRIYEIALERLSVAAADCIFIDNSVENLRAANEIGIQTILFNRDNEEYNGVTVYSFEELSNIL